MPAPTDERTPVTSGNDTSPGIIPRSDPARSIALRTESTALSTRVLEERRLIHPADSVRRQADAFRELRTRLLALGGDRNFVTLVVPVSVGAGGSFVARNLAAAFAFDDSKTALLVDCDARYPAQEEALQVDGHGGGLIDYLDDAELDLASVIYPTGIPRMHLMPIGRRRETTDESFSSFRMRTMIDSLRSQNPDRYLILDGPSVEGSPDARILSGLADFVVLVAGYGRNTAESIQAAAESFPPDKLAGIVFNQNL